MEKIKQKPNKMVFLSIWLVILSLLLGACSSATSTPAPTNTPIPTPTVASKEIPFSPFENDLAFVEGTYDLFQNESTKQGKAVKFLPYVATAPTDFKWFINLPQPLQKVDWRQEIAILVYWQAGSRSLYNIQIRNIKQSGDKVVVTCNLRQPPPDTITTAIVNYLHAAVYVRRASFQTQGDLTFTFVDQDGKLLGETKVKL
jgi:hypothetical protein